MRFKSLSKIATVILMLTIGVLINSCGPIKRSILWKNDPVPLFVLLLEGGECIPIIDGKMSDSVHETLTSIAGMSPGVIGCRASTLRSTDSMRGSSVEFNSWALDLLFSVESGDFTSKSKLRKKPKILTWITSDGERLNPDISVFQPLLYGSDTAASFFCNVVLFPVELTLILNVGADKRMHVLTGTTNRGCGSMGV